MRCRAAAAAVGCLFAVVPAPVSAQWIFDLAGAWGQEERTIDIGGGLGIGPFAVVGGVAGVERGLKPGYVWNADQTKIFEVASGGVDGGVQVDPRKARSSPKVGFWGRLEFQPGPFGVVAMWDPRNHPALGAFGVLQLTTGSQIQGELRWVHTLGHDLSIRLRWR